MSSRARTRPDQPAETGSPPASDLVLILAEIRQLSELQRAADEQALALMAEMQAVRALVESLPARLLADMQRTQGATLKREQRVALERVLRLIGLEIGSTPWRVRDLEDLVPKAHAALRQIASVDGGQASNHALGQWLGRADGFIGSDGLRLQRVTERKGRAGHVWRVEQL